MTEDRGWAAKNGKRGAFIKNDVIHIKTAAFDTFSIDKPT
jgi:hypothetical protein